MSERMCPCGNNGGHCKSTWTEAINDLIHGPYKLNKEQAEERLQSMLK